MYIYTVAMTATVIKTCFVTLYVRCLPVQCLSCWCGIATYSEVVIKRIPVRLNQLTESYANCRTSSNLSLTAVWWRWLSFFLPFCIIFPGSCRGLFIWVVILLALRMHYLTGSTGASYLSLTWRMNLHVWLWSWPWPYGMQPCLSEFDWVWPVDEQDKEMKAGPARWSKLEDPFQISVPAQWSSCTVVWFALSLQPLRL